MQAEGFKGHLQVGFPQPGAALNESMAAQFCIVVVSVRGFNGLADKPAPWDDVKPE